MIFEPGILNTAHSKGIKFLEDLNHDGRIDQQDLTAALAAKKAAQAAKTSTPTK
jgi:hypothetical protein